jgi:hypothetical protein
MVLFCKFAFAQDVPITEAQDTLNEVYFMFEGDSVLVKEIELNDVYVLKHIKFENKNERIKYLILKRKVKKVYPYAKMASDKLLELAKGLDSIKRKRARKRYTKKVQKFIEQEFSAELKKLTRTEGQILVKLIHRQTGQTAFDLVKELRSGWRAFWYNSTANLFSISLKKEYAPLLSKEDYYIEDVLERYFQNKILERQESALEFDFLDAIEKWN